MLADYHCHTIYCDGKNTPEELVISGIEKGFDCLGISGHGFTDFDTSYCMTNTEKYIKNINELKEKYRDKIQLYLGVEEDMSCPVKRDDFDYIIGSCHYTFIGGKYYPIDSSVETFKKCLNMWDNKILDFAEEYYSRFCDYINKRKPDIIGHFDLITKYDQKGESIFLCNPQYNLLVEKYIKKALESNCIFEVNTGAIYRGYRSKPYPSNNLLRVICENDGKIILSSDSHKKDSLGYNFKKTEEYLKEIGFKERYILKDNKFISIKL